MHSLAIYPELVSSSCLFCMNTSSETLFMFKASHRTFAVNVEVDLTIIKPITSNNFWKSLIDMTVGYYPRWGTVYASPIIIVLCSTIHKLLPVFIFIYQLAPPSTWQGIFFIYFRVISYEFVSAFLRKPWGFFSMGFWRESHSFCFWNLRKLFLGKLESSISRNIGNFLRVSFFYFACSQSYFLKYMKFSRVFVSWNIRKSRFLKYKEFFSGFPFPVI